jgi:hypothetical protein
MSETTAAKEAADRKRWQKFIDAGIETKSDPEVAKILGCTRQRVQQIRRALGCLSSVQRRSEAVCGWLRGHDLGTKPWAVLAAECSADLKQPLSGQLLRNVALNNEITKPKALNQPNLGKRKYTPDSVLFNLVAKDLPYKEIAKLLGLSSGQRVATRVYIERQRGKLPPEVEARRDARIRRGVRIIHKKEGAK